MQTNERKPVQARARCRSNPINASNYDRRDREARVLEASSELACRHMLADSRGYNYRKFVNCKRFALAVLSDLWHGRNRNGPTKMIGINVEMWCGGVWILIELS